MALHIALHMHMAYIFLYITMQLSRLIWWDDFIKLTEDTKYIDWEDKPGDPDPHYQFILVGWGDILLLYICT